MCGEGRGVEGDGGGDLVGESGDGEGVCVAMAFLGGVGVGVVGVDVGPVADVGAVPQCDADVPVPVAGVSRLPMR